MAALPPLSTIGILGDGQLGRMCAHAAHRLGYRVHIFGPGTDSPAGQATHRNTVAQFTDREALVRFAELCDVVTLEFENVPASAIDTLSRHVPVHPGRHVLETCQHRKVEKDFVRAAGVGTAPYRGVSSARELRSAIEEIGTPAILKTSRFGYDGKGQVRIHSPDDADTAWASLQTDHATLEGFVDFECEVSVIVARGTTGEVRAFPVVRNDHRDHILYRTHVPAGVSSAIEARAEQIAQTLANAFELVGLLAVELFITRDGEVLVNEMAPRPHNSGHWTIDGCETSQFEQHMRAVAGLPLGGTSILHPCTMTNLIGDEVEQVPALLAEPKVRVHLYGKAEARPGRKMGHYVRLG